LDYTENFSIKTYTWGGNYIIIMISIFDDLKIQYSLLLTKDKIGGRK